MPIAAPSQSLKSPRTQGWRILSSPALSGWENMRVDRETLARVEAGEASPTLRFFRWRQQTVSYGRLQKAETVRGLTPSGWALVERPTAGGIVFHENDLCLSLAWRHGQAPLPLKPRDQYAWIHEVIREALEPLLSLRLASCADEPSVPPPFPTRECFAHPVGFDVLSEKGKVVGGALARRRNASLYQGSIQGLKTPDLETRLMKAFQQRLAL